MKTHPHHIHMLAEILRDINEARKILNDSHHRGCGWESHRREDTSEKLEQVAGDIEGYLLDKGYENL